ncbi:MAG TPA: hypothetical protein VGX23_23660 [Actinocrinis sp.]|nr:hypothetical protein [Actinocrinis sp.]
MVEVSSRPQQPTIAGKLLELKVLLNATRWELLDAVVLVSELYDQAVTLEQTTTATAHGVLDPEPNREDYTPGDAT